MILGLVPPSPRLLHFSSRAALSPSDDFHSVLFPALLDLFFPNFLPPTHSPPPPPPPGSPPPPPRSISFAMCLILSSSISFTLKVSKQRAGRCVTHSSSSRSTHLHKLCQARLFFLGGGSLQLCGEQLRKTSDWFQHWQECRTAAEHKVKDRHWVDRMLHEMFVPTAD